MARSKVLAYVAVLLVVLGCITHFGNGRGSPPLPPPPPALVAPLVCPSKPFRFRDAANKRNRIVQLASYPGSGNTWVRHLIQRGSGLYTGSVYNDQSLKSEFPGERRRDSSVICVKTHYPCKGCWYKKPRGGNSNASLIERGRSGRVSGYRGTIQVLRNPFEALLSDFNHKQSGANHTGLADHQVLYSQRFVDFVLVQMKVWMDHARHHLHTKTSSGDWLDSDGLPVLLVYYDDLQRHTGRELQRMFAFINQFQAEAMDPRFAASCGELDVVGGFRRVKPERARDPYDDAVVGETGEPLRAVACEYFAQDNAFWRPQWCSGGDDNK